MSQEKPTPRDRIAALLEQVFEDMPETTLMGRSPRLSTLLSADCYLYGPYEAVLGLSQIPGGNPASVQKYLEEAIPLFPEPWALPLTEALTIAKEWAQG